MEPRARLLRSCLFLLVAAAMLAVSPGCGKRPFSILEARVCKEVDAAGKPGPQATTFSPEDKMVYVWFRYAGAQTGQKVKVKVAYTDEGGTRSEEGIETELKAGDSVGVAQMAPREGERLASGAYEAQIANEEGIGYGAPMNFSVE